MRTYGEGFVIADQSPGLLDMSVIRNTNTKIVLAEYKERNSLEMWSDENFRWLSRRLTDILGVRTKVENCVLTAADNDELTNMLRKIVLQISPEASKAKVIALSQCFMKDMSTQQDEIEIRRKLYVKWVNYIKVRGVR